MVERIDFGTDLRRRRRAAGVSLSQFANLIHYSKGHLSKIESGSQAVHPTFARLCDAALDANGELAALAPAPSNTDTAVDDPGESGPGTGSWSMNLDPDGTGYFTQLTGAPQDMAAVPFGVSPAAGRYPVDPTAALALFSVRFEQARSFAQIMNAGLALPMLIADTHAVRGLASYSPAESSAGLWSLAAQYAEYVGWMSQESGDDRQALWWTRMAVRMAAQAGDESLRPFALVRHCDVTLHADDAYQTIELAQRAQADVAATARIRGLAAQREAQGYALLGDRDTCLRALDRSARLLDEAAHAPVALMLGTWRTPDTNVMARGWCMFDLGRPAEAAELLEPGIASFPAGASRARARYALRTALAQATADEVERACEIVDWLAGDLRQIDSATVRHDVRLLHRELRRRAGQARVRELLPLLADLMRGPTLNHG